MAVMRSIAANRAMETTETTGTGAYSLEGPVAGYTDFQNTIATGLLVGYCAQQISRDGNGDVIGADYEIGLGTLTHGTPDTLARTLVLESTNGDAAVNWGAGTKTIFAVAPAQLMVMMDDELGSNDEGRPLIVAPGSRTFTRGNVSLGQQAATELTIAAGAVTPTRAAHVIDTQGDAASDDLATISTANIADGGLLLLSAAHDARTVIIKHTASPGAGGIFLLTQTDFALDDVEKSICLQRRGAFWVELWRGEGLLPLSSMAALAENNVIAGNSSNRPAAVSVAEKSVLGRDEAGIAALLLGSRLSIADNTINVSGLTIRAANKTDAFTTGSTSWTDIPDLSITLTPKSAASKFLLFFSGGIGNTSNGATTVVRFMRDSTPVGVGDAAGSRTRASAEMLANNAVYNSPVAPIFLDEPATAGSITYKMQMQVSGGTGVLNRNWSDANSAGSARTIAALIVVEIE